jgi:endonuclease YncB( thermonuclease family)
MRWIVLLLFVTAQWAFAETLRGKVIRIADGDTLTILDARKKEHRIRLAGIDAPERRQAHYETSRQSLAKLAFGKAVIVEWHKRDVYGRLVGKVEADRQDVGLAQLRAGQAWWFRRYANEQTMFDRSRYEAAELDARRNGRGLWKTGRPTPPWEWRAVKGERVSARHESYRSQELPRRACLWRSHTSLS